MTNEDHAQQIWQLVQSGQTAAARRECARLLDQSPTNVGLWRLAADVAMRAGVAVDAVRYLHRALEIAPREAEVLLQLARYLLSMGRPAEARATALNAAQDQHSLPHVDDSIGTLLTHCGDPVSSLRFFEQAVAKAPDKIAFRYNLAMAQRMNGALEAAEANLDIVLSARPDDGEAQNARSGLRRQTRDRNHVVELQSALSHLQGRSGSIGAEFALAKELEDLGEFERSFVHLTSACRRHRSQLAYDVGGDIAVMQSLRRHYTSDHIASSTSQVDSDHPIFVIGLPRSGTTLVERILGSHSHVFAAGELDVFPAVVIQAVQAQGGHQASKLGFVEKSLQLDLTRVGADYLAAVFERIGGPKRFTDKLPLNYLYAGSIRAALPLARFVAVRRNPLDVCYAMYKTLFASAYPFSYDLMELARYYVEWDRLMSHWEGSLGPYWLTVHYEDLVENQEQTTRKLLAHCELVWQSRCLEFHTNEAPVATASAVQVRSRLYGDSVGKWRAYDRELRPLIQYLESQGIRCRE